MSYPYQQPGPAGYAPQQQPGPAGYAPQQQPGPSGYPQRQPHYPPGYSGPGGIYQLRLLKHTGALILWFQQSVHVTGSREQCEAAYRDAQTHNLVAGWWSVASVIVLNWIALIGNLMAIRKVRSWDHQHGLPGVPPAQAQQAIPAQSAQSVQSATPPGWYPDPSGQPGQRYWDGGAWTNWTHPPGHR